jgi:hypothetical protein
MYKAPDVMTDDPVPKDDPVNVDATDGKYVPS